MLREARAQKYQLLRTISQLAAQSPSTSPPLPSNIEQAMGKEIGKLEEEIEIKQK